MRDGHPRFALRPWHAGVLAALAAVLVVAAWFAPLVPVEQGQEWERVQKALGVDDPRSFLAWLASACYAAAAVGCWAAASTARARRRVAWVVLGLVLVWLWFDHVTTIHTHVPPLPGLGSAGARPVELVLAVVVAPAAVVLLTGGGRRQRWLLVAAGALYVVGEVVVGARLVGLPLTPHRTSVVEAALGLAGLVLLLAASTREREAAPSRSGGDELTRDPLADQQ